MDNNKQKKAVIGESTVMHVNRGFAIPVIAVFISLLLIFSVGWAAVLGVDAAINAVINPIITHFDPEAEPIDIMKVMSPPTSESQAAKVYAEFPAFDTEAMKNAALAAFDTFPTERFLAAGDLISQGKSYISTGFDAACEGGAFNAVKWVAAEVPNALKVYAVPAIENYVRIPNDLYSWCVRDAADAVGAIANSILDDLHTYPAEFEAWYNDHLPFRSIIFNADESLSNKIEEPYGDVQNGIAEQMGRILKAYNVLTNNDADNGNAGNNVLENDTNGINNGGDEDLIIDDTSSQEDLTESDHFRPLGPGEAGGEDSYEEETQTTDTDGEEVFVTEESDTDGEEIIITEESDSENITETSEEETVPEYGGNEEDDGSCEHEFVEKGFEIAPSCVENGLAVKECSHCGRVEKYYVKAKGHVKDESVEGVVKKAPTCTETGMIEYSCLNCQEAIAESIAKVPHVKNEEGVIVKPSTCTENGRMEYYCINCPALMSYKELALADHVKSEEGVVVKASTCTENGMMEYCCINCGAVRSTQTLAKTPHQRDDGTVTQAATCTEDGVMTYSCLTCGEVLDTDTISKGHKYETLSKTEAMTCGCRSEEISKCSLCGDQKVKSSVKKHRDGEVIEVVQPSPMTYGYTLYRCADCGGEYRKDRKARQASTDNKLPIYRSNEVMEGRYQWLFYRGNDSQRYYEGTNLMTDAELAEYVSVMTTLNELCKQRGITLQICIWPNKDQVYPEFVTWTVENEQKRVDRLVEYVKANNPEIKIIYPLSELKKAKANYYDTYFKYDTHWNNAGGYIGYKAMLDSLGLESTEISNLPVYKFTGAAGSGPNTDPYLGPIADMIGLGKLDSANYTGNYNYYVKYRPEVTVDTFEGKNGAGDTRHTTAANAPNDLNFVMLGDSYRVMQLSYLEKDFTDCFLTHRSHVNDADVKAAVKNSDILVITAVERLEPDILSTAKEIIAILQEQ